MDEEFAACFAKFPNPIVFWFARLPNPGLPADEEPKAAEKNIIIA